MTGGAGRAAARARGFWRAYVSLYLFYFYVPAADLVTGRHSATATVLGALALLAFVVVYVPAAWIGVRPDGRRDPWWAIGACAAIGSGTALTLGGQWCGLLVFVAFLAGGAVRRVWVGVIAVEVTAAVTGVLLLFIDGPYGPLAAFVYTTIAGVFAIAIAWLVRMCVELDRARDEAARLAVADERLRFARDLHDLLGHSLSVIALKSELAGRLAAVDPERTAAELRDIETVTRQALAEVRAAVTGYRADAGLTTELERARLALTAAGVDADVRVPDGALPASVDELFAWTVREATTNVVRHASARRCAITVSAGEEADRIEVVDDGVGAGPAPVETVGHGLGGLSERVTSLRGAFTAATGDDGGFRLVVQVPR